MNEIEIRKTYDGGLGRVLRPYFDAYVNGVLIGGDSRKWLATAIAKAVAAGYIQPTGDTTAAFAKWAAVNDRAAFDRMPENI